MKLSETVLDRAIAEEIKEKNALINTNFLKEWQPFDELNKKAKRKIVSHFMSKKYTWQPTNDESSKVPFTVYSYSQIENMLGLPYTSSSDFAGLWVTNSGYLWANATHYFIGFAINELGEVIGIAHDENENELYVKL